MLSPKEASKRVGKSKASIIRDIGNGKLSASRNERGHYQIDPSELARVYGAETLETAHETPRAVSRDASDPAETCSKIEVLRSELSAARQTIEDRDKELHHRDRTIDDLRDRLDKEGEERRKLTAMITDQREPVPPPEPRTAPRWWLVLTAGLVIGGMVAWIVTKLPMASA